MQSRSYASVEYVQIQAHGTTLEGELVLPRRTRGIVVLAQGGADCRQEQRARAIARVLQDARLGTLLIDLLSPEEEREEIETRADRLLRATEWLDGSPRTRVQRVGYFAASAGAAAALIAAAARPRRVFAVVTHGGWLDLASADVLSRVHTPTLLIVGGADHDVVRINRSVHRQLRCEKRLHLVEGATHGFEEPGAFGEVATQARDFFVRHLTVIVPHESAPWRMAA